MQVLPDSGSALVFNGHLWHGGATNRGTGSRRAFQVQFVATASAPPPQLPADMPDYVEASARALLGVV